MLGMRSLAAAAVLGVFSLVTAVLAASPATAADEMGLLTDGGTGESLSLGTDTIAVWLCDAGGSKTFTVAEVTQWATDELTPFFDLISRGRYQVEFVEAGTFVAAQSDCLNDGISMTTNPGWSSAFVIDNTDTGGGLGSPGVWFSQGTTILTGTLNDSAASTRRGFWVGGGMFDFPATPAHEIGHTIAWPHSGSSTSGNGQYDNPGDLMSGHGVNNLCPIGGGVLRGPCETTHTIAFNRYASGWIDRAQIAPVTKPTTLELSGPESPGGVQMAVVPTADPLIFSTIEARPAVGYDVDAGISGVMLHTIDQVESCGRTLCWGLDRRQRPAVGAPGSTDHILAVGESAMLHGFTVTNVAETATGYRVEITGAAQGCAMGPNRFTDVSAASTFSFADIGCIRILGITTGVSPTAYAPGSPVTREQMASFLARLYRGLGGTCSSAATPFGDLGGSFAAADIACIYHLGVTTGTSAAAYGPTEIVSREQMASFLSRLWRALGKTCASTTPSFTDIGAAFAPDDIACVNNLGIAYGTSATTYSPGLSVNRETMAAFLGRFWRAA